MPTKHWKLGPSKSSRYVLCPGSVLAPKDPAEEGDESPAAREGTRAHQLLEHCLEVMVRPHEVEYLEDEVGKWMPDTEMVKHIQDVIDYLGRRQIKLMPSEIYAEREVNPEKYTQCEEQNGTLDIEIYSKYHKVMEIADLKYGRGIKVDPEDNSQLVLYAAGALAELTDEEVIDLEEVVLTIMQPRIPSSRGLFRSVTLTAAEVISKAKEIGDQGNLALSGFGPKVPGDVQCRWCDAKMGCEERQQHALTASGALFGDVSAMSETEVEEKLMAAVDAQPQTLSNEKLSLLLDGVPALLAYCNDLRKEAKARLQRGRPIPGYKLVVGKRSRAWTAEEDGIKKFLRKAKIKVADYTKHDIKGVAAIRGLLPEHRQEEFDTLWEWKDGSPTVAQSTDERPAMNIEPVTFGDTTE